MVGLVDGGEVVTGIKRFQVVELPPEAVFWRDPPGGIVSIVIHVAIRRAFNVRERIGENSSIKPLIIGQIREGAVLFIHGDGLN